MKTEMKLSRSERARQAATGESAAKIIMDRSSCSAANAAAEAMDDADMSRYMGPPLVSDDARGCVCDD